MSGNRKLRRVSVVFSDAYHTLQLVEVKTYVKQDTIDSPIRIDRNEVEQLARARLEKLGLEDTSEPGYRLGIRAFDFVGVLVAHEDLLNKGRITWAELVEVQEAVAL